MGGTACFVTGSDTTDRVIFQVKFGKAQHNDIATLWGDMAREAAALAVLLSLEVLKAAASAKPDDQQPLALE